MVEPPMNTNRRKVMQHAVSLLAIESGYQTADKNALELLTEMFQSILFEMGRSTKSFTELAGRVEPTVGDFTMALIDMGLKVDPVGLRAHAFRTNKTIISSPKTMPLPKVPVTLATGKKKGLPAYIPDYFPPMPDSHAYIRTPTHKQPITDYALCREKGSQQKRDLERSLSKFFARTSSCYYLFPENKSLFPLISPRPVNYVDPLVPKDPLFMEDDGSIPLSINYEKKEISVEEDPAIGDGDNTQEQNDQQGASKDATVKTTTSWELIDNPFLKAAIPRPKNPNMRQQKK